MVASSSPSIRRTARGTYDAINTRQRPANGAPNPPSRGARSCDRDRGRRALGGWLEAMSASDGSLVDGFKESATLDSPRCDESGALPAPVRLSRRICCFLLLCLRVSPL